VNLNESPGINIAPPISNQIKLPNLPLPEYNHEPGASLELFFANFESIVNKHKLSEYEKFLLLTKQVHNEPLILLKSLLGGQQSYTEGKLLLQKAFGSKLNQQFEVVHRLIKLRLSESGEPFSFISEMRTLVQSFKDLNIDIETVLQCCVWGGMPESLKLQFVHITNCNKPSLQQIEDKIFEATERFLTNRDRVKTPRESLVGYAASVEYSGEPKTNPRNFKSFSENRDNSKIGKACILCSSLDRPADHVIYKCKACITAKQKVDKLKSMNYCVRCGTGTHFSRDCKFAFYKYCFSCRGKHFTYLCLTSKNAFPKNITEPVVQNGTATINCGMNTDNISNAVILPTFTVKLSNDLIVRALRDTGAQTSFVSRDILKNIPYKVIKKDFTLTVNGFNAAKQYVTDVIELKVKLGNGEYIIEAIIVPNVNIHLKLPGLGTVVGALKAKGYKLADKILNHTTNEINNIEIILGANALYCIPERNISFGVNGFYSETEMGLMLCGRLSTLAENLDYLPKLKNVKSLEVGNTVLESKTFVGCDDLVNSPDTKGKIDQIQESGVVCSNVWVNFCVTDQSGILMESELLKATDSIILDSPVDLLHEKCIDYLNCENLDPKNCINELNENLVSNVLDNTTRDSEGRLIMPLMWDTEVNKLLGENFNLSKTDFKV
jgi:hypothetical protein